MRDRHRAPTNPLFDVDGYPPDRDHFAFHVTDLDVQGLRSRERFALMAFGRGRCQDMDVFPALPHERPEGAGGERVN